MKVVFSILLFGFGFGVFSQEQVAFYFDTNKFELNASERNHSIDISNFAAGTYIMKIQNTEINKVIKITKE